MKKMKKKHVKEMKSSSAPAKLSANLGSKRRSPRPLPCLFQALCDCLSFYGAVPAERLLAWMHRRRFSEALRRHPLACHESLESLLQAKELALSVAARGGLEAVARLGGSSRAMRTAFGALKPELVTRKEREVDSEFLG